MFIDNVEQCNNCSIIFIQTGWNHYFRVYYAGISTDEWIANDLKKKNSPYTSTERFE